MIKYNLKCKNNHEFESWFSDSNEFEKLNKKKLLECIYCSSKKINKSIMAPMVSTKNKDEQIESISKDFKNLARWYLEISDREAVIKGYNFMKKGEAIPKP